MYYFAYVQGQQCNCLITLELLCISNNYKLKIYGSNYRIKLYTVIIEI